MKDGKNKFFKQLKLDKDTKIIIKFVRQMIMDNKDICEKIRIKKWKKTYNQN